jgi:hypothetical protein
MMANIVRSRLGAPRLTWRAALLSFDETVLHYEVVASTFTPPSS